LPCGFPAPWLFADELKYSEFAKSFAATGHFALRGTPGLGVGPVYPVLISPAYALFDSVPHAYVLAKAINCVLMSLAGIPTYFLARRLLTKPWSLAAAALALAVPSMVYTGTIMTENVFYPIFLTASLAIVRALELPSARRQFVVLGLIALAFLTRPQAVALIPALVTAIVGVSAVDAAGERLRLRAFVRCLARYLTTWAGLVGGLVALVGWETARGRSPLVLFGDAQGLWHQHYSIQAVARWFLYHLAELDLYVGVLPFAAFLILATFAFSRGDRALRIFARHLAVAGLLAPAHGGRLRLQPFEVRLPRGLARLRSLHVLCRAPSPDRAACLGFATPSRLGAEGGARSAQRGCAGSRVAVQRPDPQQLGTGHHRVPAVVA